MREWERVLAEFACRDGRGTDRLTRLREANLAKRASRAKMRSAAGRPAAADAGVAQG